MLDAVWHRAQFASPEDHSPIPEFDDHFPAPNKEELVLMFVMVPRKYAGKFGQFQFLAIKIGNDLWTPVLMDRRKFFGKRGFRHGSLNSRFFSANHANKRA